jgi:hypothetical protein
MIERCEAAERVLNEILDSFEQGDVGLFERHLTSGAETLVIGTDPAEWWQGSDEVMRAMGAQIAEIKAAGIEIERGELRAYREGPVAWSSDKAAFKRADGTAVPMRITAVLTGDGDTWKLVQWHSSVGVANKEVVGVEITT